eukprot:TRINITY_DN18091_c0_g1_i4.p1 TRINITY_DN18091_c0_g1~~TRINITY_DN18091_c0_g1_i4.p1  ORF type:complete len:300 (-),score=40.24 TRINITY_DN18091_c0_g1_i4:904-1803(-)
MYGLLVLISETKYMLPAQWRNKVAWTQLFIGFSTETQVDFSLRGSSDTAFAIVLAVCLVAAGYGVFWIYLKQKLRDRFRNRALFERAILTLGQFVYLPVAVAAVRLVSCCQSGPLGLDVKCDALSGSCSSSAECNSTSHAFYALIASTAIFVVLCGVPVGVHWAVQHGVLHEHAKRHMESVKLREAERILGLSDKWENFHFHLFSSFRSKQVLYKLRTMSIMCWMALTAVLLGPEVSSVNSSADPALRMMQMSCFTVGVLVDVVADIVWGLPYRCNSSNCVSIPLKVWILHHVIRVPCS